MEWSLSGLNAVLVGAGVPLLDENGTTIAYTWLRGSNEQRGLECSETVVPNSMRSIERISVLHVEGSYKDAVDAATVLSKALTEPHAEGILDGVRWPPISLGDEWRWIQRVPPDPAVKQVGTLQLTLARSGLAWQIGVAYGQTP